MKDFYQAANVAFPDFDITVWGEYDMPGCSVREVAISGTPKGDGCGIPGTGRHVRWQLAGLFLFGTGQQAGKLLAERIYFDNETIMRQLRGEMDEASVVDFPTASGKGMRNPPGDTRSGQGNVGKMFAPRGCVCLSR